MIVDGMPYECLPVMRPREFRGLHNASKLHTLLQTRLFSAKTKNIQATKKKLDAGEYKATDIPNMADANA